MISQEEMNIVSNLIHKELTHLFSGHGVTEVQYIFEVSVPLGHEHHFGNSKIDPATEITM